jgi:hypothetical protein
LSRVGRAWRVLDRERRIAALAAVALLVTMFLPWYGLQSLNRKSGAIYSHSINAFGDVSFVEAAVFLVAAGVCAMLFGRAEGREFRLPGGDGGIVLLAGAWATLLIFYRVFDRPSAPNHYPVGIEWGFVLAFAAAGGLAYAGWRMRLRERPEPPVRRRASAARPDSAGAPGERRPRRAEEEVTTIVPSPRRQQRPAPVPADPRPSRPRYPPSPKAQQPQQLSFDEEP